MIFVVAALMATAVAESNSNKPIRSQQRQMKLASPSGIGARGMSSSDRSSSANSNENRNSVKDRSAPLFSLRVAVTEVKDEVTDIFESIVFADNNSERLENAFDAIKRHKLLLSASAVALVLKSTMGGKGYAHRSS